MPDLSAQRDEATIQAGGVGKLLKKYASHDLIILDEWLLDKPNAEERRFLFELLERRLGHGSIIFCTQYKKEDWHTRLGGGVHADAIMDRVIHNAIWVETGQMNMREHYAKIQLLESRES
jgi:DNA replication protein DnaC